MLGAAPRENRLGVFANTAGRCKKYSYHTPTLPKDKAVQKYELFHIVFCQSFLLET